MNYSNHLKVGLALAALAGAGCKTHTTVLPLSNGYEEVSHPHHTLIDDPDPPRISLQHRGADGKLTRIWPSLYGIDDDVIHGDLAIFVAEKAYVEPDRETRPRLFGARAPDLPLDLTDEVLWRWTKANGRDFGKALGRLTQIIPVEKNGGLELSFQFWSNTEFGQEREDWPDNSTLQLSWEQIEQILRAVKAKGVIEKDLRWHSRYIGEKF
jgi:hypothetical protein